MSQFEHIWDGPTGTGGSSFNVNLILTGPSEDLWADNGISQHFEILVDENGNVLTEAP